jgi:hypothetical protein
LRNRLTADITWKANETPGHCYPRKPLVPRGCHLKQWPSPATVLRSDLLVKVGLQRPVNEHRRVTTVRALFRVRRNSNGSPPREETPSSFCCCFGGGFLGGARGYFLVSPDTSLPPGPKLPPGAKPLPIATSTGELASRREPIFLQCVPARRVVCGLIPTKLTK